VPSNRCRKAACGSNALKRFSPFPLLLAALYYGYSAVKPAPARRRRCPRRLRPHRAQTQHRQQQWSQRQRQRGPTRRL
jgi:hypothetical protein